MISRKAIIVLFGLMVLAMHQYSQAQEAVKISLDGPWNFKTDPNNLGEEQGWFKSDLDGSSWDKMDVPGNWNLRNEYAHYTGKGWYKKSFTLPAEMNGKNIILHFEAVYHDCTVWLNGEKLGTNHSGFLPFEFDATELVHADKENTIALCADNTFKRGAIWNYGGIRRPVTLSAHDGLRIRHQHITPEVDLDKQTALVKINVFLDNFSATQKNVEGNVLLSADNGYEETLPFSVTIPAGGKTEVMVETAIRGKDFHLWDFDEPFLYRSEVKLDQMREETIKNRFGLRKIEVDAQRYQFKLNGESVRLMGMNLVPDGRTTGNTMPLWRIKEDVDLLKSLNANFARLSHLPLPEEMMDYLDERGILVFSEIPLWGYDPLADPDHKLPFDWLERLIDLQYNHPSIIGWSTGNEIGYFPTAKEYVKKSVDFVKKLDSTRLVSNVTYTAEFEDDYIQFTDLGLLNKYGKNLGPVTRLQHRNHPGKLLFYSEYGIGQSGEGLDTTWEFKPLIDSLRNYPYLMGASLWTYNDYRSSYEGTKELSENRAWGVVDVYRRKKKAFFDLQKEHAPVRGFKVEGTNERKAVISFTPRMLLDLPSYTMRKYRIFYQLEDRQSKIIAGGFINLPEIRPGQDLWEGKIEWEPENAYALKVALLSPQLDRLIDTTLYFQKPVRPDTIHPFGGRTLHNNVPANTGAIRVFYDKVPFATSYKLKYGINELDKETALSNEDYLDITGLALDETYQVQLVAVNTAGESPSKTLHVKVDQKDFLPPGVRHVESAANGFFVGYASEPTDFIYRVRYRESGSTNDKIIQSNNPGMMFINGLENGTEYRFEVQRVTNNNSYSLWTRSFKTIPDGNQLPPSTAILGVFHNGSEALVSFKTVDKAVGYELQYRESGREQAWKVLNVNTAQVGFSLIKGLNATRSYEFRIASINENGQSAFSDVYSQ